MIVSNVRMLCRKVDASNFKGSSGYQKLNLEPRIFFNFKIQMLSKTRHNFSCEHVSAQPNGDNKTPLASMRYFCGTFKVRNYFDILITPLVKTAENSVLNLLFVVVIRVKKRKMQST